MEDKNMKKVVALLLGVILLATTLASTALADTAEPKYTATASFDADELLLSGTVKHTEGTGESERLYVRVTYFMADGSYTVVPAVVAPDFTFESMFSGTVVHIAVQVVNSSKIVPGTYTRFGGYEFDVK